MKKNKEQVFRELQKQYTLEEIAESFIFSEELPAEEQENIDKEFLLKRMESLQNISYPQRLKAELFGLKIRLEDYFARDHYEVEFSFGNQLRKYIEIVGRTQTEISDNLSVHKARLSRIINGKENPNPDLMYRLQQHSDGAIPAFYWWKLLSKELEHQIKTDEAKLKEESTKVSNAISLRA